MNTTRITHLAGATAAILLGSVIAFGSVPRPTPIPTPPPTPTPPPVAERGEPVEADRGPSAIAPTLHRRLIRSTADRYLRELSVRADVADRSPHDAADRYVRELSVRAELAARSPHDAADRYVRELLVRAGMASESDDRSAADTR